MKKLITLLLTGFMISATSAQWNPNTDQNLSAVSSGNGVAFSATTNDGKTYIAFWKPVASVNFELWLQILDENGNKQLGADGVMLSNQIPMSTSTVVEKTVVDASGNFYIGVTGTGAGTPAFVFKITPQGTSVWPNGINVGSGYLPTILPLSNNDIVVGILPATQTNMQVQRYNTAGQPVWAAPIGIVSDDPSKQTAPADFFELPNNEIGLLFHKKMSFGTTSYLFAQKLDFNGNILWSDGPIQVTTKSLSYNAKYSSVLDGSVAYFGYSTGQGNRFDAYLQKFNFADGNKPWGVDGVDFDINQTNFEKNMRIAFSPGSPYIWGISNYTTTSQGSGGEYVQKFDKNTGARMFTDNAKQVFPITTDFMTHSGDLFLVEGKPYFVMEKRTNPTANSLNAVLLNDSGDLAWSQQYIPMATFIATKSYLTVLKPINKQAVIVFNEQKTGNSNAFIYAQNLVLPAASLGTRDMVKTKSISLYPNPATDVIHLDGVDNDSNFVIYNAVGQLVKSGEMQKGKIAVQELVKGQYMLKLKGQDKAIKFIKK
ncbi:T9SS type A sorting domain-containing protein [Chryseobacterium sp. Ch-15]|uniref:T9SS type A sorting domain-containing protein n=1 Tax=Chryseobacterium muglaense TaxID=2893752 RepID=A0A9Q3UXL8_9FLAO|nr:T9SS type A sorting domain-containing protein [Chryseobacterium muglaense]MBD3905814.1 T9SS type A sorting domain-containing protein [Chryseobacterium muglaense]MCC9035801.1 T9SS type A sorting domain-containing protein [Chryseobacterium muglaense]MCM2555511.1 T9SS type A sorting domain-containing protein [Chryseobacterium muglaense]